MGLPLGIVSDFRGKKVMHQFQLRLIIPLLTNNYPLKSKVNTQLKNWLKVDLAYHFLYPLGSSNHHLGAGLRTQVFYREYDFLDGFAWEVTNSLALNYGYRIMLNDNHQLLPQLSIPALSYINRKPSLTFDEAFLDDFNNGGLTKVLKYGKWKMLFDDLLNINLKLSYFGQLNDRLSVRSDLGLNYYQIKFPEKGTQLNIPFTWYLSYHF